MKFILELLYYCLSFSLFCVLLRGRDPANLLCYYPKELLDRALAMGIRSREDVRRRRIWVNLALTLFMTGNLYLLVRVWNGAEDFAQVFWQSFFILFGWNMYDGIVMDKLWPENNDYWMIPSLKKYWKIPSWWELAKRRSVFLPVILLGALLAGFLFPLF